MVNRKWNTFAIAGFVLSFFLSVAGVVLSGIALSQIRKTGERGRALAVAGLGIGLVAFVLTGVFIASGKHG
ncbi:hypothetical protein AX769_22065 (plasmid) [Frondihabitans sp. PAMC 28766]|uniref:DUF4190 domain-containing protein n=1 Tax=Frondihabitans sp. PAMC 28766 TaxID=1795630 RepID=UPI00078E1D92|nr:DUF4190 domain-containing protein [Frondihabitans sp. PAMC 28766]AMM22820.1 hypothetical protein AX769_22065 [Frondihabitans sp. PAMC 28766]